jgi:hypothetical protein
MNPNRIVIAVLAYRGEPNRVLLAWLEQAGLAGAEWRFAPDVLGVDLAREVCCNRFLAEIPASGRDHLIMVDADMAPDAEASGILSADGDLVYCGYTGHAGTRGHFGDRDFGCGLCRISAEVLGKVGKPWFVLDRRADVQVACECDCFRVAAGCQGFTSQMVGRCWHQQTILVRPTQDGSGMESQWPRALLHGSF